MEPALLTDRQVITWQLGRAPRGLRGIAARCPHGYPQVIVVRPLIAGAPFPTTYWLTCPFLVRAIDRLEAAGTIKELEARVRADHALAARFAHAHRAYIAARLALLTPHEHDYLERTGMLASLTTRGIGGTADFTRVKCLHMHVAHALVADNPVGTLVLDRLPDRACPSNHVVCATVDHAGSRP